MIFSDDREYQSFTDFVKINYGLNLYNRRSFVEMRIEKLMHAARYTRFRDYFEYVCADVSGVAVSQLISALTVNHTLFYRESMHFDFLRNTVLPYVYKKEQERKDFRIWSAGCSSGEEPYTIAMVLSDFLGINKPYWNMQILATDISEVVLRKALAASYPVESVEALKSGWVRDYFMKDPENSDYVLVSPVIRNEVVFRKFNLISDSFNFRNRFHFIFCRNVMIYFDEPTRYKLIRKFHDILEDGGYLFIGMSETIDKDSSKLEYIMPSVYRKRGG